MRPLAELINKAEPGWPMVQEWIAAAKNKVEVLPPIDDQTREAALVAVQVTTRSPMGAVVYETGGILVDHGWIRILGSGSPRLPRSLPAWNEGRSEAFLLIADDLLGGFFALDGGGLGLTPGKVAYFAPDSLEWEDLGFGYTDFLNWCFSGDLEKFYGSDRWPGWKEELERVAGDQAFSIIPPLWAKGPEIAKRSRKPIPITEIYSLSVGKS